jgi:hypothetical protein
LKRMHFIHDRYSFEFLISDEIMLGSRANLLSNGSP